MLFPPPATHHASPSNTRPSTPIRRQMLSNAVAVAQSGAPAADAAVAGAMAAGASSKDINLDRVGAGDAGDSTAEAIAGPSSVTTAAAAADRATMPAIFESLVYTISDDLLASNRAELKQILDAGGASIRERTHANGAAQPGVPGSGARRTGQSDTRLLGRY
ncbi:hypothetical protein V8E36_009090 [Tilletia maclaganii]